MTTRPTLSLLLCLLVLMACNQKKNQENIDVPDQESTQEDDWYSLMSLDEWHAYNMESVHEGWVLEDGILYFDPSNGGRGDLVTNSSFDDFELSLEWKIDSCGNSGIMWAVKESADLPAPYFTGPEMQILDDDCHADGNIDKHRAGDLYDMIAGSEKAVKSVGEWNLAKIRSENGLVAFHLNDVKIVEFQMYDAAWEEMVANSKFKDWDQFGKHKNGKIALQDHSDQVWFRNVRIREL